MYKVKYGGKEGKTINLIESPDMVAIRTRGNRELENVSVSRHSRELIQESTEVANFPEAGVTVRRVSGDGGALESTNRRDETRTALKQEENIRFAGRVLQDEKSGEVMLYTENFFVKFKDSVSEADCLRVLSEYKLVVKNKLPFAPNAYFVSASEGTGLEVFDIAEKLLAEKPVEYCHPELVQERRFKGIHPLQWHLGPTRIGDKEIDAHINIEKAWKITRGKGVTIAIVDDGVDIDHPEFSGRIVHPYDATNNHDNPRPQTPNDNHGTPCAGLACAAGLKDGASGTAPEALLMPIRLRSGLGSMAEAQAFAWAADHGADVISCSWGPTDGEWWNPEDPIHQRVTPLPDSTRLSLQYALTKGRQGKGCVILFAAGNGNEDTQCDGYCSFEGLIAVAACNDAGIRSVYSDFGKAVWVSFPSGDYTWRPFRHTGPVTEGLRTTDRRDKDGMGETAYINTFGGTSGACPGMAGVVGLMLAANPALTNKQVKEILRQSCRRIDEAGGEYDAQGHSVWYGYGRIDAGLAVENARKGLAVAKPPVAKPGKSATPPPKPAVALAIEGTVKFSSVGEVNLLPGEVAGNFQPAKKVIGFRFRLKTASKTLKLRYKANVAGVGIVQNKNEDEYVGAASGRQRLIGFSLALEGAGASLYDLEYTARLEGQTAPAQAKNGVFCGSDKKSGKTIQGISVRLQKK